MELSNRGASVHADRTGHGGRDLLEPSGDADGLCILKSPRHQRASGAHAQNQPGTSKSTATKLAAPRRLIMSPASPKYERFGIVRLCNLHFCGQSAELQVCKTFNRAAAKLGFPPHACREIQISDLKKTQQNTPNLNYWDVTVTKK